MKKTTRKLLAVLLAAVLAAVSFELSTIPVRADDTFTAVFDVVYDQTEARSMLDYINSFRTGNDIDGEKPDYWNKDNSTKTELTDLKPLVYDYSLERTAMQRAAELAVGYSHTRPDGSSCFTAWDDSAFWYAQGENIAAGYNSYTNAHDVFVGWREDEKDYSGQGHRRNMLSSSFTRIGIAHVRYNGVEYWAQSFGKGSGDDAATAAADETRTVSVDVTASGLSDISLSAEPGEYTLTVGDTASLPAVTMNFRTQDSWPSFQSVTAPASAEWTSGDEAIAAINGGVIRAESAGSTTLTGSIYGASVSVTVAAEEPAHIHVPGETIIENEIPATCTSEGSYDEVVYCTICRAELGRETKTIGKLEHIWDEGAVTTSPTCTENGVKTFTCTLCGIRTEEEILSAGHSFGDNGFCAECGEFIFTDITGKKSQECVSWAYQNGIVKGTGENTFSPDDSITRAQFVMMLWKMNGSLEVSGKNPFEDVTGKKTIKAVLWALDEGIIVSGKTFDPEGEISRVQIVMMLWKMSGSPKIAADNPFSDVTGKKTVKAVVWAFEKGIVRGTSPTTFDPDSPCTRLQLATMLYKYVNNGE